MSEPKTTHFGFSTVNESEKAAKVGEVFHSVASRYDLMNDVMSAKYSTPSPAATI
jgi:demethylmenaquinone methyltransferase/2-methoxy-6-polyprenyl-1,4-benzoquinol methylase